MTSPSMGPMGWMFGAMVDNEVGSRRERILREKVLCKEMLTRFRTEATGAREMYKAGLQNGLRAEVRSLADVIQVVQSLGLGRAAAIEESNCHVVFRVFECACCRFHGALGCDYLAGFLAGAMMATKRFLEAVAKEIACGEFPLHTCIFRVDLRHRN